MNDERYLEQQNSKDFEVSSTLFFQDEEVVDDYGSKELGDLSKNDNDLRQQLLTFFSKYNPEKLKTIDFVVAKYSKQVNKLNQILKQKYGANLETNQLYEFGQNTEKLLEKFFLKHNPSKISSIKTIMEKYSVSEINAKLQAKYGENLEQFTPSMIHAPIRNSASEGNIERSFKYAVLRYLELNNIQNSHFDSIVVDMQSFKSLSARLKAKFGKSYEESELLHQVRIFLKQQNLKTDEMDQLISKFGLNKEKINQFFLTEYGKDLGSVMDLSLSQALHVYLSIVDPSSMNLENNILLGKNFVELNEYLFGKYGSDILDRFSNLNLNEHDFADALNIFFSHYDPKKESEVLKLSQTYRYNQRELRNTLKNTYRQDLLLPKLLGFFQDYSAPGEPVDWVKIFIEVHEHNEKSINKELCDNFGFDLNGKPHPVKNLRTRLLKFFEKMNIPEGEQLLNEYLENYASHLDILNYILRYKFGEDLNGKSAYKGTPILSFARINFEMPKRERDLEFLGYYTNRIFPRTDDNRRIFQLDDFKPESKVQLLCFGLPLTGYEILRELFVELLGMQIASETDAFERLRHLIVGENDELFDVFSDKNAVFGLAPTFFFQELLIAYSNARVIITVRDFQAWWEDIKSSKDLGEELCHQNQICLKFLKANQLDKLRQYNVAKFVFEKYYDLLLSLIPPTRRILLEIHSPDSNIYNLKYSFPFEVSEFENWLTSKKFRTSYSKSKDHPNELASLHKPKQQDRDISKVENSLFILGQDSKRVLSELKTLGIKSNNPVRTLLDNAGTSKTASLNYNAIAAAESFTQSLELIQGVDSVTSSSFIFTSNIFDGSFVKCLSRTTKMVRKSLLRANSGNSKSSRISRYFSDSMQDESLYILKKQYQDLIDSLSCRIPKKKLLVMNFNDNSQDPLSQLCKFTNIKHCQKEVLINS